MITPEQLPDTFYRVKIKALILNEKKEFLLGLEEIGFRGFPGGGLDHGEDPKEGLRREIKEETGLEVTSIFDKPSYVTYGKQNNGFPCVSIFYEVEVKNLDFTPSDECVELRYFSKESIQSIKRFSTVDSFINTFNPNNH